MPILEAQACGLPVVTSNLSAMPEVAGKGAVLVDPLSKSAIRKGVEEILGNEVLRNEIVESGYVNVQKYSLKKVAEKYKAIYEILSE